MNFGIPWISLHHSIDPLLNSPQFQSTMYIRLRLLYTSYHRLCPLYTPSPLPRTPLASNKFPSSEQKYGMAWRARAYDYNIVIPTLTPVLRFPAHPCLSSSVPPGLPQTTYCRWANVGPTSAYGRADVGCQRWLRR